MKRLGLALAVSFVISFLILLPLAWGGEKAARAARYVEQIRDIPWIEETHR